jgi:signal transduction histidine kinase/DNA-binding response OmpR family regulator
MEWLVLAAEAVFVLLFVATLIDYGRHRGPIRRDLVVVFSGLAILFVLELWTRVTGAPAPTLVNTIASAVFLLQPVATLHLVSLVRRVPSALIYGGAALLVAALAPIIILPDLPESTLVVFALAAFGVFIALEAAAAGYLILIARARRGPSAARMWLAAIGTAAIALAILVGLGGVASEEAEAIAMPITSLLALAAGVAYLAAFLPPAAIRGYWQSDATVRHAHALISRSSAPVEAIWATLADLGVELTGGAIAVVDGGDGGPGRVVALAGFGDAGAVDRAVPAADAEALFAMAGPLSERAPGDLGPLGRRLAAASGALYASVVRLELIETRPAAVVVLSTHRSLFHASDLELLAALGAQTAIVAERRASVAEQEALAARLAETVEALRGASQAKSDFLASMSHELRTPLNAIIGFSDLMRTEAPDEAGNVTVPVEWIDHVQRGGQHLLGLVNDVLDLAKVEAGRLDLVPEPLDVGQAVAESIAGLRPIAERKRIALGVNVRLADPAMADRGRFRQILYNLLSNAIKYTPDEGRIDVTAERVGDEIRIAVRDTGVGIAEEDLPLVFEEFRQVGDVANHAEGTGLGLALTRRLVEAHDGRIELQSTRGIGSTFTVVLPIEPATPADAPAARPGGAAPATVGPGGAPGTAASGTTAPTVLVVEDDLSAVRLIRAYLEPAGYAVRSAVDGETAIGMARERRPAAIVLDVLLPRIDGWEVLRRLKADPDLQDVPVIIVTVVDEREIGLALGAVDYLVKPLERGPLLASLARFVAAPRSTPELRVLAIDDDPTALDLIEATLTMPTYRVIRALDGRQGLELALASPPDVIICDLLMPDLDGFTVVAELKRQPTTRELPILVMTAHDLTAAERERLRGQILGVVAKGPGARDGLLTWLAEVVGQREAGDV